MRKVEYYKNKKIISSYKMDKEIITFGNIEVVKQRFHQQKSPFLVSDVDISNIVVYISFLSVKKVLNTLLATKMLKKLDCYEQCF